MDNYHVAEKFDKIGSSLLDLLKEYYGDPGSKPVIQYKSKSDIIADYHRETAPDDGRPLEDVIESFKKDILPYSVHTWHPYFLNQMFAGSSFPAIIGDLLASMMNPTLATWEMSPIATLIEQNTAQWMAQIIGMPKGSSGIFLPGGSLSNLLALTIARNRVLDPNIRDCGLSDERRGAIICSEASHYSVAGAANLLGIGLNQVKKVKVNRRQEMDVDHLQETIQQCRDESLKPFVVVATTGITVTGGFDPLGEIADLLKDEDIHLHVDAAFGGGMALTDQREHLFGGIHRANSLTWDAHKWMHTPLTCSVLLVPDPEILEKTFSQKADYLFHPQQEKLLDDLGKSTLLCGKRFDALKIWLLWNTYGTSHFREVANERVDLMRQINQIIKADPDFVSDYEMVSPILCFTYQNSLIQQLKEPERTLYSNRMHRYVRESIKHSGRALFNITKLNGKDQFRMVLINPLTDLSHVRVLLEDIRSQCQAYSE